MRILSKALVVAVGLLLTGAAVASADTCFQDSFGQVLIGKSFLLPTANNCKPFNGFIKDRYTPLSGNVCKTWNNT
jgi:hypothetical protein